MKHNIAEILNKCKEDMRNGSSVEDCVNKYGSKVADLELMLQALKVLSSAPRPIPASERKQELRDRLLAEFEQADSKSIIENVSSFNIYSYLKSLSWSNQSISTRIVAIMSAVFVLGGSTLALANGSMPGTLLYPIKRIAETARIGMVQNDADKGILYVDVTQTRITEYITLGQDNPSRQDLEEDIKNDLRNAEILAFKHARVRAALEKMRNRNRDVLLQVFHKNSSGRESGTGADSISNGETNEINQKQKGSSVEIRRATEQDTKSTTSTTAGWKINQNPKKQNIFRSSNSNGLGTSTCTTNINNANLGGNPIKVEKENEQGASVGQNKAYGNITPTVSSGSTSTILEPNTSNSNEVQAANEIDSPSSNDPSVGSSQDQDQGQGGNGVEAGQNGSGSDNGQNTGSGNQHRGGNP